MENNMFVDNPFELTGLYPSGIYMVPQHKNGGFEYKGQGMKKILNIVYYDDLRIPDPALDSLYKIMKAVVFQKVPMQFEDFALINAAAVMTDDRITSIFDDFKPEIVIIWADKWFLPTDEVLFYQKKRINNIDILRCHSIETVTADVDRKKECWLSVKQLFGM